MTSTFKQILIPVALLTKTRSRSLYYVCYNRDMKFCSRCEKNKDREAFYTNPGRRDGLATYCKECQKEYSKSRYHSPEQHKQRKMSEEANKVKRKESSRKWYLKSTYSLTIEQYDNMLVSQSGLCEICNTQITSNRFFDVDHDHACCNGYKSCGKCVRGLVCFNCNSVLGHSKESVPLLLSAVRYIEKYRDKDTE